MQKPVVGEEADPDGEVSSEELMIAVELMVRHVRRSAVVGQLSTAAASALGRLTRAGPQRLTELARDEGVSQPNMTQLVTRMERAGLVRRVADAQDGRGVRVQVTALGREVFHQRRAQRSRALQSLIDTLGEAEQRAVRIALPALARAIEEHRAHP